MSANNPPTPHHVLWVRPEQMGYFKSVLSVHGLSIISCRLSVIFIDVIFLQEAEIVSMYTWNPFRGGQECQHPPPPPPNLHLQTCILLVNLGWTYLNHLRQNRYKVQTFGLFGLCWGERSFHWCCQIPTGRQTHGVSKFMLSGFSFVQVYFDYLSVSMIMYSLKLLLQLQLFYCPCFSIHELECDWLIVVSMSPPLR